MFSAVAVIKAVISGFGVNNLRVFAVLIPGLFSENLNVNSKPLFDILNAACNFFTLGHIDKLYFIDGISKI